MFKKTFIGLVLFSCSLVISISICEVLLRIAGFSYHLYPERVEFGWPDPQTLDQSFSADNELFWVPREPIPYQTMLQEAERHRPDIVYMGCSVTAWSKYPFLLEDLLNAGRPDHDISGINLAVVGWSSYQGLQQLQRDIITLKPKLITIFFGWNDHWIGFGIEDKKVARIHSKYYKQLERFRFVQLLAKSWIVLTGSNTNVSPQRVSLQDFERNLEKMVDLARAEGITPVLITAPTSHIRGKEPVFLGTRWLKDLSTLVPLHQQYIAKVRKVATDNKVVLCDLARDFEQFPDSVKSEKLFYEDGIHFRESCDPVAARLLYDCLVSSGTAQSVLGVEPQQEVDVELLLDNDFRRLSMNIQSARR